MQTINQTENKFNCSLNLEGIKILKEGISFLNKYLAECYLTIDKDKITLNHLDNANVCLIELKLYSNMFTEYVLRNEDISNISFKVKDLYDILKNVNKEDIINLEVDFNLNNLKVIILNTIKKEFNIELISDDNNKKIPELTFKQKLIIDNKAYINVIKSFKNSEIITINLNDNKLNFTDEKNNNISLVIEVFIKENIKSMFSYNYLKDSIFKLCNEVTLSLSDNYPLQLDYKIIDKLSLKFILAPRIEG